MHYSLPLAKWLTQHDYDLFSKTDLRFLEGMYKVSSLDGLVLPTTNSQLSEVFTFSDPARRVPLPSSADTGAVPLDGVRGEEGTPDH